MTSGVSFIDFSYSSLKYACVITFKGKNLPHAKRVPKKGLKIRLKCGSQLNVGYHTISQWVHLKKEMRY